MAINLKNLKYLKQGIENLTPLQLCNNKVAGYGGMVVGCVMAAISLFITKQWGWFVFVVFLTWVQLMTLFGEMKVRKQLIDFEKETNELIKNGMEMKQNESLL